MRYSHTQRRKKIKRLKDQFGDDWYFKFVEYVLECKKKQGESIGTLQEIMDVRNGRNAEQTEKT